METRARKLANSMSNSQNNSMESPVTPSNAQSAGRLMNLIDSLKSELLDVFKKEIGSLKSEVQESAKKIQSQLNEVVESNEFLSKKYEDLKTESDLMKIQIKQLESKLERSELKQVQYLSKIEKLSDRVISSEGYSRRENLIFEGIKSDAVEKCDKKLKDFFVNVLKLPQSVTEEMHFQRCHRLPRKGRKPEPIICQFLRYSDRQLVWDSRKKLKNTTFTISEDFPPEITETRKLLLPIMKKARETGKRAYVSGVKLVVDGTTYTKKTLHRLPHELDPAQISTRHFPKVVAFFSSSSPLSNFYPCPLIIDDMQYDHVEQYYQMQKALFARRPDIARQMHCAVSPAECKALGDSLTVKTEDWLPDAKKAMRKACEVKFNQFDIPKKFLLDTKDKVIAEATTDKTWGIGLRLNDTRIADLKWEGDNLMGQILMTVRDSIR